MPILTSLGSTPTRSATRRVPSSSSTSPIGERVVERRRPVGSASPRSCRRCPRRSPRWCPTRRSRTCRTTGAAGAAARRSSRTAGSGACAPCAASNQNVLSSVSAGRGRFGRGFSSASGAAAGAAPRPVPGLNLRMRNSMPADQLAVGVVVLDTGGHEVADAEPGRLLLGDRFDHRAACAGDRRGAASGRTPARSSSRPRR